MIDSLLEPSVSRNLTIQCNGVADAQQLPYLAPTGLSYRKFATERCLREGGGVARLHPSDTAGHIGCLPRPNVRGNRPAEAGGVRLARDSGEAAARQPYSACRSGSG
jgi:hypothetical protein